MDQVLDRMSRHLVKVSNRMSRHLDKDSETQQDQEIPLEKIREESPILIKKKGILVSLYVFQYFLKRLGANKILQFHFYGWLALVF